MADKNYSFSDVFAELSKMWEEPKKRIKNLKESIGDWYGVERNGHVVATFGNRREAQEYANKYGGYVVEKVTRYTGYGDEYETTYEGLESDKLTEADENTSETQDTSEENSTDKAPSAAATELTKLNYEEFVKKLDDADYKSKAFANYIKNTIEEGDSELGNVVKLSVSETTKKCSELKPTQDKVILGKSLGLIMKDENADWLSKILKTPTACFGKAGEDNPNGKTIIYGNAIIDGHHRWSKIYTLNGPDAECGVIAFSKNEAVTADDMLKATELAIRAVDPALTVSKGDTGGENMLTCSEDALKAITDNISPKCLEVFKAWKAELDSKEKIHAHIWKNIQAMQSNNKPILMNSRAVMPQTDLPANKAGGAVNLLKQGIIDTTAAK